jgi:lysophospholipase L1-like esterase
MRKYLILLLAAILFSCSPVRKYRTLPEVTAWEQDIQAFGQLDKNEKYPDDAILFAGSSSIRLWTSLKQDIAPYSVIQRGYGGAKLSDFAVYADRIVAPHPCMAIVLFVANDITGSKEDKTPEEVASLFRDVLKTIRKTHPSTPVFWIEITPTASRWQVWPEIQKANSLIKNTCNKEKNTYFIETHEAFLNENGLPQDEYFREDKLHLTEKGYAVWKGIIMKEMDRVLMK